MNVYTPTPHDYTVGDEIHIPARVLGLPGDHITGCFVVTEVTATSFTLQTSTWRDRVRWWFKRVARWLRRPHGQYKQRKPSIYRASGDCQCAICGLKYSDHAMTDDVSYDGARFLHQLCDGDKVKL